MRRETTDGSDQSRYKDAYPAFQATFAWIENILGTSIPSTESYRSIFATGETLCNLLNAIVPGAIKRINHCPNRASAADNLTLFLSACEEKCRIPQSRLFSIDDFDDILERRTEAHPKEEKNVQHAEKVAISLFWLARFADQSPNCAHLPKLNYSAFSGILPRSLIQNSLLGCVGDGITSRFLRKHQPGNSHLSNGTVDRKPSLTIERQIEPHQFVRPPSQTMGNTDSTPLQTIDVNETTSTEQESHPSPSSPSATPQANNNGLEDDAWQDDLDAWRERRRRTSRLQATKMTSLEEAMVAEEKRKQEAIRDRMRQIKSQRSLSTNCYIPTTDIIRPLPPSSPGMALLTGGLGVNVFDLSEEASPIDQEYVQPNQNPTDEPSKPTDPSPEPDTPCVVEQPLCLAAPPAAETVIMNNVAADHQPEPVNGIKPDVESVESSLSASRSTTPPLNRETTLVPSVVRVFSPKEYKEVKIRIQSMMKTPESRWGMAIRAEGPLDTAPFVVERVKIGSTADVCDVARGDILVQLNGTKLNLTSDSPGSMNLSTLEQLLDQLSLENGSVNLHVLRKWSQNGIIHIRRPEDFSDVELDEESAIERPFPRKDLLGSDIDEPHEKTVSQGTKTVSNVPGPVQISVENDHSPSFTQHFSNNLQLSHSRDFDNSSPRTSEIRPMEAPLRNPLSTQILDYSEVGATNINTPSQADDSSRSAPVLSASHPELTDTQPNYVSLAGASVPEEQSDRTILITRPAVDNATVEIIPWQQVPDADSPPLSEIPQPNQQFPDSPTLRVSPPPLPPPPLPLCTTGTISANIKGSSYCDVQLPCSPKPNNNDPYSVTNDKILEDEQARTLLIPHLPSPPSPTFLGEFNETVVRENGQRNSRVSIIERPHVNSAIIDRSHLLDREHPRAKPEVTSNPAGDPHLPRTGFDPVRSNGLRAHANTNGLKISELKIRGSPPPPPVAPLLAKNRSTVPTDISLRTPYDRQERLVTDTPKEQMLHIRDISNRRSYPPPPPPPPSIKSEMPPQPPRVPLNRGIDPKGKCTACTQELGTGDLMIIGSMNLCYHLACFVCSWCGIPLSDGLSNADVRIRMGQLYCQACYPSRHGHKTVPQGDSNRKQTPHERTRSLPLRSPVPISCSDHRMRPREPSNHARPQSGTKPPTYL